MPFPPITTAPEAPVRGENQTDFSNKANALVAYYSTLVSDVNAFGAYLDTEAAAIEAERIAAQAAQTGAETAETNAETARDVTLGYRNEAEGFKNTAETAAAAAQSAAGLPSLTGNAGLALVVNAAENGVGWDTSIQKIKTEFTASGTFTKNAKSTYVYVEIGGAGGSGASGNGGAGGAGGEVIAKLYRAQDLGASQAVVVGSGGAAVTGGAGNLGGNSSFDGVIAYGGQGGFNATEFDYIARSRRFGDTVARLNTNSDVDRRIYAMSKTIGFSGNGNSSISSTTTAGTANTIYGGGGGGQGGTNSSGGVSAFHGNGGDGINITATPADDGVFPCGGGGGHANASGASGAGADGFVTVWEW